MERKSNYNVVFRGTGEKRGNYKGVITWKSFNGINDFEEFCKRGESSEEIIATGVTQEEAINLCGQSSFLDVFRAARKAATLNGRLNEGKLETEMGNLSLLITGDPIQGSRK
jgi:hypothetical protein